MRLSPGSCIGVYQVVEPIGAGGMGQVYRARDTRLGRDVALKVLPDAVAADPGRRARLEREARVLAALNHPNIATLYGLEESPDGLALVMELVDGETLADRLALSASAGRGLPLHEALTIARQIAEALEFAHAQGIVHRDLKPANVKVRADGNVKVLDFGLAKAFAPAADTSVTVTAISIDTHAVIGTPAYMSPEQVRGEVAGPQADIWSFGVMLYELLTGLSPFARPTTPEAMACVLGTQADYSRLPPDVSLMSRHVIRRCLEKDPKGRWQHMGDVRIEIEEALAAPPVEATRHAAVPAQRITRGWMWLAAALGLTTVALLGIVARTGDVPAERVAFSVFPPTDTIFLTPLGSGSAAPVGGAISPDGRLLAFTATDKAGNGLLWLRPLDSLTATALPGTEGAALPFWSPDSQSLAFFAPGKLKRIDIANRGIQNLADITRGSGGTWSRDGVIVFAASLAGPLRRVSAAGGDSPPATTLSTGQRSHRFPHFLPNGRHFLYYAEGSGADDSGVFVGELDAHNDRHILAANSAAVYAHSGHLLFVRQGSLYAQPFDPSTLQVTGNPAAIAASIPSQSASPAFSASNTGVVTYLSGVEHQQYAWFDRHGSLIETVGQPGHYRGIDLASDGRVAVHRHDDDGGDVWLWDQRGSETRVTLDATLDNSSPTFSPDGSRIAFGSLRKGKWGLYQKRSDGTGPEELIVESDLPKSPADWTPDGKYILYWLLRQGLGDVWQASVTAGDGARPLLDGQFYEGHTQVSPDGQWVAYASGRSGQSAIYVRPFPSGEGEWKISSGGGVTPRWRGDGGKELFYVTSYNEGTLVAVSYRIDGRAFVPIKEEELFPVGMVTPPHSTTINVYHTYVVSPDGARFLIPRPVSRLKAGTPSTPITVHTNWTAMLAP